MLVISRKKDESIIIGDGIIVTILSVDGDRVKIGIEAPRDLTILRGEIFEAVQEQTRLEERLASEEQTEKMEQLRQLLASEVEETKESTTETL